MYKQPTDTYKYEIVERCYQGYVRYSINCYYIQKKYIWFGKWVEKVKQLKEDAYDHTTISDFCSLEDAEKAIENINRNYEKTVRTITR